MKDGAASTLPSTRTCWSDGATPPTALRAQRALSATFRDRPLSNGRVRRNYCEPEAVMRHFRFAALMLGVLLLGVLLLLVPHAPFAAEAAAGGGAGNLAILDSKG